MKPDRPSLSGPQSKGPSRSILTINGGSSSIKFAVFPAVLPLARTFSGQIERIGEKGAVLVAEAGFAVPGARVPLDATDHGRAAESLIDWLVAQELLGDLAAIGHRIVHGGSRLTTHQPITPDLVAILRENQPLDLAHLPREIALIEALTRKMPNVLQVACFDTAFHRDLPRVAQLLPVPRPYTDGGVRRLGFHGLSYEYLLGELRRVAGDRAADGRVILAHLGSGASLAAIRGGRPLDTTMAFTPTSGLVMGTRPGDLDPGLVVSLMRSEGLTADQMDEVINTRCGLLGVSGTTSNMRDLLVLVGDDPRAAEAVELFCYAARKWIGAFAAVLGGLDTLVFSGGIGEHADAVRGKICEGLGFLGTRLHGESNRRHAAVISDEASGVTVRVIPTDEELVIAREVRVLLEERR